MTRITASDTLDGALYVARVMHRRRIAPHYRFVYRVFYMLLDIDRLADIGRAQRLFSYNRFNLLSFHDRDHGAPPGGLRAWVDRVLSEHGVRLSGGRVRVFCMPRVLGFVFNPISIFYCEDAHGELRAIIAEVRNTFGERHCYVLDAAGAPLPWDGPLYKQKRFHVSPFLAVDGGYRFRLQSPGERLRIAIQAHDRSGPLLDAVLAGERRTLDAAGVLRTVLAMPLAAVKVVVAIHWQALKIWLRGATFHRKPPPPQQETS